MHFYLFFQQCIYRILTIFLHCYPYVTSSSFFTITRTIKQLRHKSWRVCAANQKFDLLTFCSSRYKPQTSWSHHHKLQRAKVRIFGAIFINFSFVSPRIHKWAIKTKDLGAADYSRNISDEPFRTWCSTIRCLFISILQLHHENTLICIINRRRNLPSSCHWSILF